MTATSDPVARESTRRRPWLNRWPRVLLSSFLILLWIRGFWVCDLVHLGITLPRGSMTLDSYHGALWFLVESRGEAGVYYRARDADGSGEGAGMYRSADDDKKWQGLGFWVAMQRGFVVVGLPNWFLMLLVWFNPGIRLVRRKRRVARGRCVKCGFDLRSSPTRCPECGAVRAYR